jgi:flagellin
MSLGSIITNNSAMVALASLNATQSDLAMTEKQISTGYRVADAVDDGAAYAVAQRVRSDVGALTSANQQLGNAQGLLTTTSSALNNISQTMISARQVLVKLADSTVQGDTRTQYQDQYRSMLTSLKGFIEDAAYSGKTLIGDLTGSSGSYGGVAVIRNELGGTYGIATFSGSGFYNSIAFDATTLTSTVAQAYITATGTFINQTSAIGSAMNTYGYATNYVQTQVSYNSDKIDAMNSGLGALIDANLTQESAQLQALQVRQQLGTQALSIANQAPQSLLTLFR